MVEEARLERSEYGLWPATDGWFVVNVRDAVWTANGAFGEVCFFESESVSFPDVGYSLLVFRPGQPSGLYHREANQEDFLVLPANASCSSKARSGRYGRGNSCTARRTRSTSSSRPETARA